MGGSYPRWPDSPDCTLLLGVDFEQFVVYHSVRRRHGDLAAAYNAHEDDAVIFDCPVALDTVVVNGTPVRNVAAIRRRSLLVGGVPGRGLFIDSRDVGRPVCFRLFRANTVTGADILRAIATPLPDGAQVFLDGPEVSSDGSAVTLPPEGTFVTVSIGVMCSESLAGSVDSASPAPDDNVSDDGTRHDLHDDHGGDSVMRGRDRSRSPRGAPPGDGRCRNADGGFDVAAAVRAIATPVRALTVPPPLAERDRRWSGPASEKSAKETDVLQQLDGALCPMPLQLTPRDIERQRLLVDLLATASVDARCASPVSQPLPLSPARCIHLSDCLGPRTFALDASTFSFAPDTTHPFALAQPWSLFSSC